MSGTKFQSLVSDKESTDEALAEIIDAAGEAGLGEADLAFVFFTAHHRDEVMALAENLWLELDPQAVVGCSAEGVIGGDVEIERAPGLAVLVGKLPPGARVHPFHITPDHWRPMLTDPPKLLDHLRIGEQTRALIGFGDPWTCPMAQFMQVLDQTAPGVPLIGGMASSARQAGESALVRNDDVHDDGFVGVSISGDAFGVDTLVSQGCRPIGEPLVVTKGRENIIEQLRGKPAVQVLKEMIDSMSADQRQLLQNGLLVGIAMSEFRDRFKRGDFVVRNVVKIEQDTGAIAVADYVRVGQTIQFHVRDAASASEDLSEMLATNIKEHGPAAAALLFSCNGRGTRLFDSPNHDIQASHIAMPKTPVAGFFAAGELGPVGKRNFMHGHTASFAIFREGRG